MARTLLIPATTAMGHDWLPHFAAETLIVLDPALAYEHPPAHLTRWRKGALEEVEFYGSLRAVDDPIRMIEAAFSLLKSLPENATILMPPGPRRPIATQLMLTIAGFAQPDRVVTTEEFVHFPWPVGAEISDLDSTTPEIVTEAARRGYWLKCAREGYVHRIELTRDVRFRGGRFGSGVRQPPYSEWRELHLDKGESSDLPDVSGLIVGLGRESGPGLGWGIASGFALEPLALEVRSLVPPPLPVTVISLGRLRLDEAGKELETIAPWSV